MIINIISIKDELNTTDCGKGTTREDRIVCWLEVDGS